MSACANTPVCRLAAGQIALHDLHARSCVVAVEGDLQLAFRDHSLAWLCEALAPTSLVLREGQCFIVPQRGVVSISALQTAAAAFALQAPHTAVGSGAQPARVTRVARQLAAFLKTTLRRAA